MVDEVLKLVDAASRAASEQRWEDAERAWMRVQALDPQHVQALYSLGVHAHQRGEEARAVSLLSLARTLAPNDPMIALTLGVVYRESGQADLEWGSINAALAADPYFLPALLSKAEFLARHQRNAAAAVVYRNALRVAPGEAQWPPALRGRLQRALAHVAQDSDELATYLAHRVGRSRDALNAAAHVRWDEAISILAGKSRPYHAECNQLHVPRLPAITFHDRAMFPWVPDLEARTDEICAELEQLVNRHFSQFTPYVAYQAGDPINQWGALNHSRDWSSFHLWAHGLPVEKNLALCPATKGALELVDSVSISGLCPNAMFSALAPHTAIPPHHGETNARLVAHLPLIVPVGCMFRVGFDRRVWEKGKVFVFDDSIEHEARNDSDALRVVLIFDVWNPLLSQEERAMVTDLGNAMHDYRSR